jgi:hypothetical protein
MINTQFTESTIEIKTLDLANEQDRNIFLRSYANDIVKLKILRDWNKYKSYNGLAELNVIAALVEKDCLAFGVCRYYKISKSTDIPMLAIQEQYMNMGLYTKLIEVATNFYKEAKFVYISTDNKTIANHGFEVDSIGYAIEQLEFKKLKSITTIDENGNREIDDMAWFYKEISPLKIDEYAIKGYLKDTVTFSTDEIATRKIAITDIIDKKIDIEI